MCRVRHGRDMSNNFVDSVTIKSRDCNRANVPKILRFFGNFLNCYSNLFRKVVSKYKNWRESTM